jgi:hypothetical protein
LVYELLSVLAERKIRKKVNPAPARESEYYRASRKSGAAAFAMQGVLIVKFKRTTGAWAAREPDARKAVLLALDLIHHGPHKDDHGVEAGAQSGPEGGCFAHELRKFQNSEHAEEPYRAHQRK